MIKVGRHTLENDTKFKGVGGLEKGNDNLDDTKEGY